MTRKAKGRKSDHRADSSERSKRQREARGYMQILQALKRAASKAAHSNEKPGKDPAISATLKRGPQYEAGQKIRQNRQPQKRAATTRAGLDPAGRAQPGSRESAKKRAREI